VVIHRRMRENGRRREQRARVAQAAHCRENGARAAPKSPEGPFPRAAALQCPPSRTHATDVFQDADIAG
ncbi:hypothetical protein, partial [Burkholderia pseudomallei]